MGHQSRDDAAAVRLNDDHVILSTTDFYADRRRPTISAASPPPTRYPTFMRWAAPCHGRRHIRLASIKAPCRNRQSCRTGRSGCLRNLGLPAGWRAQYRRTRAYFGLAVTGTAHPAHLKRNDAAQDGDGLILTKPLGIGILTTAEKQNKLEAAHVGLAAEVMCQPNDVGGALATMEDVHALTDVTGFGLAGHLLEMCEGQDSLPRST